MQLFEHLQGLLFIACNSPDKAMDQLQVFDDGLAISSLQEKIIMLLCVQKILAFAPLYLYNLEALGFFSLFSLSLLPFWQVTIRSSFSLVQQLLSSHGEQSVCDPP